MTATTHERTNAEWQALALDLADAAATTLGTPEGDHITHHKAVVMAGTFTATPRARQLTRAAHMQGDAVPVTVRFSNGFPSVEGRDSTEGDPRGMAVKFYLQDGSTTDLVCQDWPVFPAPTPEKFRDLLRAQHESIEATEKFLVDNPDVAEAAAVVATGGDPPLSWATMAFNSMNAFKLVNADGEGQWVRWKLDPEAGEKSLPASMRATADKDYLMTGVLDELPIRYRVLAQLATDDDQTIDPSRAWPAGREWAELRVIEITEKDETREMDGDILVHDPMRLTDGIEPSDDPILRVRPWVYAESVRRRSGAECPCTCAERSSTMTRLLVAALYVWDEYPGLRAGRLYAGKGDIGTHPRGETHAVASADSATTVCGQSRRKFTYEFAESVSLIAADACPHCRIGAAGDTAYETSV